MTMSVHLQNSSCTNIDTFTEIASTQVNALQIPKPEVSPPLARIYVEIRLCGQIMTDNCGQYQNVDHTVTLVLLWYC